MMKIQPVLLTFLLSLLSCSGEGLQAQTTNSLEGLELEKFILPNGIHGNHVQAIAQDNYGFMWFGSQYGLHRWDGHKFKTYVHGTWDGASISSNYIECIYVAKDGSLWIGTWGEGLNHFQHETDKFIRYRNSAKNENSISSDFVSVITEDNEGNLWIGTQNGLDRMDLETGEIKHFRNKKFDKNSLDCDQVRALYFDSQGTLWVGTGFPFFDNVKGGLNRYVPSTESFVRYTHEKGNPESLHGNLVRAIFEDRSGQMWIGSSEGVQQFDRRTGKFSELLLNRFGEYGNEGWRHITFIFEDQRRRLWTGHFSEGVLCWDPKTNDKVYFNAQKSTDPKRWMTENSAWTMLQSKDGVLWLSTAGENGRVYRIKENAAFSNIDPLPNNSKLVESAQPAPQLTPIINRLGETSQYQTLADKPAEQTAAATHQEPEQVAASAPKNEWVTNPPDGTVWIIQDEKTGAVLKQNPKNNQTQRFDIGYLKLKNTDWKNSPLEDSNGNYWVCLENGLLKLDGRQNKGFFYDAKQLSGKPPFKGMVMDRQGALWLLGQSLLKFEPETERAFSFENGAASTNLPETADSIFTNDEGNIVLQTDDHLHEFNPTSWTDSLNAPILRITEFELLDLNDKAAFDSSQQASFWETNMLELNHFQNAFFFRFAVMDFQSPELHKLEYMLENHDKNWRVAEGDPRAIYANVPPGFYRFKVRGANQFGVWGEEASLNVFIQSPWWKTWWAYFLYLLLALLTIYWAYRFQLNRRLAENEAVRLKELHDTKSRLYTNITHEFRTPLTIIMGMAKQIKENPKANLDKGVDMINRNGEQLLGLVNQLLDLSKLEGGKMEFKPVQGDIVHFIKGQVDGLKSYAADRGIGLHFIPDLERLSMEYDPEKMQQVLANILSNAIKFTPSGGHVYVNMDASGRSPATARPFLTLKIRDTGKGIPADALPHIFDRFYQVDGSSTREGEGSGIGLSLTKELVDLMGGEIKVKSWEGAGTEFILYLPIKNRGKLPLANPAVLPKNELAAAPAVLHLAEAKNIEPSLPLTPIEDDNGLPTLLLIEDNPDVVAYLATCLQDQYSLLVGKDGQEGVEIAFNNIPDIIITDVMMPHKDGFEVSQILKNDQRTSHIPIIMLTAKADMGSKLEGLEKGVDAYLSKPFNKEELIIRLKKLLEGRKRLQQYYQSVAGLVPAPAVSAKENGQAQPTKEATEQEDYFVIKVRRSVENHLDDFEFNVEKLCKDVGMSHSQLHRKLSAVTGLSATHFIRSIRLSKAKELLRQQPPMSIIAVAMDCGFNDAGYFGRVFKKEVGMTPMEWQEGVVAG
ncbi:MAG: two-component regulator propeller domain-containing protein [Saprospiraceae bacterium]